MNSYKDYREEYGLIVSAMLFVVFVLAALILVAKLLWLLMVTAWKLTRWFAKFLRRKLS